MLIHRNAGLIRTTGADVGFNIVDAFRLLESQPCGVPVVQEGKMHCGVVIHLCPYLPMARPQKNLSVRCVQGYYGIFCADWWLFQNSPQSVVQQQLFTAYHKPHDLRVTRHDSRVMRQFGKCALLDGRIYILCWQCVHALLFALSYVCVQICLPKHLLKQKSNSLQIVSIAQSVPAFNYNPKDSIKRNPNKRRRWLIPFFIVAQVALKVSKLPSYNTVHKMQQSSHIFAIAAATCPFTW